MDMDMDRREESRTLATRRATDADIDNAMNAVADFQRKWEEFQNRFDRVNQAFIQKISESMKMSSFESDGIEYDDGKAKTEEMAQQVATMLKTAKHAMVLTGAGISTNAGICDYRGPNGKWTMEAKGLKPKTLPIDHLVPTYTHMTLRALLESKTIKKIVSTNVDGLHRRSGVEAAKLTEVHGNCFVERCNECGATFERPFPVRREMARKDKRTGGKCTKCTTCEPLVDTIVNFGDSLQKDEWEAVADFASTKCDLLIVLGSSITVMPTAGLPTVIHNNKHPVVIVNKMKTPHDSIALKVHCDTDAFMRAVVNKLKHVAPRLPPPARKVYAQVERTAWRLKNGCCCEDLLDEDEPTPEENQKQTYPPKKASLKKVSFKAASKTEPALPPVSTGTATSSKKASSPKKRTSSLKKRSVPSLGKPPRY
eukprot:TRINITY_DN1688_c3_g1_i1.p1 TRINITY_DN1688_c3_g1~~TRINITY_DN1688_c3_g1_i1.p1  ORF type:complete len:425 (+),score=110.71 TRINITY_DN1688_c3_g1_i1:1311-2585(+)